MTNCLYITWQNINITITIYKNGVTALERSFQSKQRQTRNLLYWGLYLTIISHSKSRSSQDTNANNMCQYNFCRNVETSNRERTIFVSILLRQTQSLNTCMLDHRCSKNMDLYWCKTVSEVRFHITIEAYNK